jgi:hypothetical protein
MAGIVRRAGDGLMHSLDYRDSGLVLRGPAAGLPFST